MLRIERGERGEIWSWVGKGRVRVLLDVYPVW